MNAADPSYGALVYGRRVAAFTLTETLFAPHSEIPRHAHDCAYVSLVLEGGYMERSGVHSRLCERATVILHPPGEVHSDRFLDGGARCFNLRIDESWSRRVREYGALRDEPLHFRGGSPAALARRIYRELRLRDLASPLAIEGLTLELLAEGCRRSREQRARRHPPSWLDRAREILESRAEETITLTGLADAVGIHPVHLARSFRRHFGCTVGDYRRRERIQSACRKLAESSDAIADIALATGFSHQSHFARIFKRLTGTTPAAYRAKNRQSR